MSSIGFCVARCCVSADRSVVIGRGEVAAQAAEGKIFGGWLVPAVEVEVIVAGAWA